MLSITEYFFQDGVGIQAAEGGVRWLPEEPQTLQEEAPDREK